MKIQQADGTKQPPKASLMILKPANYKLVKSSLKIMVFPLLFQMEHYRLIAHTTFLQFT